MAKRVLGDYFLELKDESNGPGALNLIVRSGTSSGEGRFEFRELLGWIDCFALEITADKSEGPLMHHPV